MALRFSRALVRSHCLPACLDVRPWLWQASSAVRQANRPPMGPTGNPGARRDCP